MSEKKPKFSKEWWKKDAAPRAKRSQLHKFEQMRVTKSEDLPELMTLAEAAEMFKRSPRTVERWAKSGELRTIKVMGRFFTTPEYIAEFIEVQNLKHG